MNRILVVEDEQHLAEGLRFNLEAEGYRVEVVETGEAALELLFGPEKPFDIVVLDPPTFSRSRSSGVFRAEKDFGALVERALRIVEPEGILLCCLNAHQLSAAEFKYILKDSLPSPADLKQMPMPEDFPGSDYLKSFWVFL